MLFEFLKKPENRKELAQYIQDNVPELLECDPNNHVHNMVDIIEYNSPTGKGYTDHSRTIREHYFNLVLRENSDDAVSCQSLYRFTSLNDRLENMEDMSIISEWGYKIGEGWKYPNLGTKVKSIINQYFRKKKLEKLNYINRSG